MVTATWSSDGTHIVAYDMAEGELWLLYALTGDQVERFASGLVPYPHLLTRGGEQPRDGIA